MRNLIKICLLIASLSATALQSSDQLEEESKIQDLFTNLTAAETTTQRLPLFYQSDKYKQEIEAFYQNTPALRGDLNLSRIAKIPHSQDQVTHWLYQIKPNGTPPLLILITEDEGKPKINWNLFSESRSQSFKKFIESTTSDEGTFHLFIEPIDANYRTSEKPPKGHDRYLIYPPIGYRKNQQVAFVKKGSEAKKSISAFRQPSGPKLVSISLKAKRNNDSKETQYFIHSVTPKFQEDTSIKGTEARGIQTTTKKNFYGITRYEQQKQRELTKQKKLTSKELDKICETWDLDFKPTSSVTHRDLLINGLHSKWSLIQTQQVANELELSTYQRMLTDLQIEIKNSTQHTGTQTNQKNHDSIEDIRDLLETKFRDRGYENNSTLHNLKWILNDLAQARMEEISRSLLDPNNKNEATKAIDTNRFHELNRIYRRCNEDDLSDKATPYKFAKSFPTDKDDYLPVYLKIPLLQPNYWSFDQTALKEAEITLEIEDSLEPEPRKIVIQSNGKISPGWEYTEENDTTAFAIKSTNKLIRTNQTKISLKLTTKIDIPGTWESDSAILPKGEYISQGTPNIYRFGQNEKSTNYAYFGRSRWDTLWLLKPIQK